MTTEELRELNDQYAAIARTYPIEFVEPFEVEGMLDEGVGWPPDTDAGYAVMRNRKVDGRMRRVVVHIEPGMLAAVRWALTDSSSS